MSGFRLFFFFSGYHYTLAANDPNQSIVTYFAIPVAISIQARACIVAQLFFVRSPEQW